MNELHSYKQQHDELRSKIAKSAKKQLFQHIEKYNEQAYSTFKFNSVLIQKNTKIKHSKLKKSPCIFNGTYDDSKLAFTTMAVLERDILRRRCKEEEKFEDDIVEIYEWRPNATVRISITEHAIYRAFERAWWCFKDKSVNEWVQLFANSANYVLSGSGNKKLIDKSDGTFVVEGSELNAFCQLNGKNGLIIRTYTPPTGAAKNA